MDNIIKPNERLFRAVAVYPWLWDTEHNRPTSALFKNKNGVSVDRDGGRTDKQLNEVFITRFGNIQAVVYISVQKCIEIGTCIKYKPLPENEYHSEIHESEDTVLICKSKAKALSENVIITYMCENVISTL